MPTILKGSDLIQRERHRQIVSEGWSQAHDDAHRHGEMAVAAARYALQHTKKLKTIAAINRVWPWASHWWKPKDPIRNLVRAGALIAAEIDRLQRLPDPPVGGADGGRESPA